MKNNIHDDPNKAIQNLAKIMIITFYPLAVAAFIAGVL